MADAALYGHLVGAARTPLLGQLLAGAFPAVLDFYDRTRSSHFPDDPPRCVSRCCMWGWGWGWGFCSS